MIVFLPFRQLFPVGRDIAATADANFGQAFCLVDVDYGQPTGRSPGNFAIDGKCGKYQPINWRFTIRDARRKLHRLDPSTSA